MWTPSVWELGIVLMLVLVLFGAGKLPTAFSALGKALKNFRDAQKDDSDLVDVTPPQKIAEDPTEKVAEAEEVTDKAKA
ncbi:MAG: twin-arginine translocase TatA/TatE family subunit [Deltaproteobacteria bacterium]|nr:twin-arginine translocase TatA/TatE family subunit [Deltaproteobacteria bacterium]MBW2255849.1 twin-arginine translocase TatA/TatE family subunit [Deltaproteobacteria bacterium]